MAKQTTAQARVPNDRLQRAVLNVLQGYIKSDMESQKPLMPKASHTFFMHFMGIAREAVEEYEATWSSPSNQQVIQASEFVLRPWKP